MYIYINIYIYIHIHVFRPFQDSSVRLGSTNREKLMSPECSKHQVLSFAKQALSFERTKKYSVLMSVLQSAQWINSERISTYTCFVLPRTHQCGSGQRVEFLLIEVYKYLIRQSPDIMNIIFTFRQNTYNLKNFHAFESASDIYTLRSVEHKVLRYIPLNLNKLNINDIITKTGKYKLFWLVVMYFWTPVDALN